MVAQMPRERVPQNRHPKTDSKRVWAEHDHIREVIFLRMAMVGCMYALIAVERHLP
jgi:hypothetical protein